MKIKTSELIRAPLDWVVAQIKSVELRVAPGNEYPHLLRRYYVNGTNSAYHPSTNWAQGGPIAEAAGISALHMGVGQEWLAFKYNPQSWHELPEDSREAEQEGPTELIAKLRCLVFMLYGAEVEVPDEVCK